ncbi:MAG: TrkH family potassium uptake protein [candidate division KSB1 bacterium]|nr:TrkH family potassium uptake protein [candidate division KSB1 bacterium]
MRNTHQNNRNKRRGDPLNPQSTLALSFLLLIFAGTVLLALPWSAEKQTASMIDALFTATSAVCVTGLIVVDTGVYWSGFGQGVILALIQTGGLGIMTFSTFFAYILSGRLNIRTRTLLEQSVGGVRAVNMNSLLLWIVGGTLIFELLGAVLLSWRFAQMMPLPEAIYTGVFHAVSAFCNAGFSLFSDSLMSYRSDLIINLSVMLLIILGGLGFWVMFDLRRIRQKTHPLKRVSIHTRITLTTTALLLVTGFAVILLLEWSHHMASFSVGDKLLTAAFQSVTPRTAGFNTLNIAGLTHASLFFIIVLMIIGASPGSCGGGIKTTTFAVLWTLLRTHSHDERRQITLFDRGVSRAVINKVMQILLYALAAIIVGCLLLCITEANTGYAGAHSNFFLQVLFETASALGTVGLSMGLTAHLSEAGKLVITILMFAGRIGPLTLSMAVSRREYTGIRYAEEDVWVG